MFVHLGANLWLTLSKQIKMRCALQKETFELYTLLSCKKEKGHLNDAPICKQFFLYQTQNVTSIYGNAYFESDNATLSQVYLNVIK